MRLGDLNALGGAVYEKFQKHYGKSDLQPLRDFYKCVMKLIANAQTIDAVPVVHGKWIKTVQENGCAEWTEFRCSVCGAVFDGNDWLFSDWKGCPVCLARMDGDGNG